MKNQKGGVGVVVAIVIAIIAVGGIWYGVSKSKGVVDSNIPSDWSTYANAAYGFEVMYPDNTLPVNVSNLRSEYSPIEFMVAFQDKAISNPSDLTVRLRDVVISAQKLSYVYPGGQKGPYNNVTSIDEYKKSLDEGCNGKEAQKAREDYEKGLRAEGAMPGYCSEINDFTTQDGVKGIVWTRTGEGGSSYLVEFIKNGILYTVESSAAPIGDEELVNQIAKTFRFTK